MDMHEVISMIHEAEQTLRQADTVAERALPLIVGRLRQAGTTWNTKELLRKLKRELRGFNMTTRMWTGPE